MAQAPILESAECGDGLPCLRLTGAWTTPHLASLDSALAHLRWPASRQVVIDASALERLDTGGAWVLHRLLTAADHRQVEVQLQGLSLERQALLELVRRQGIGAAVPGPPRPPGGLEQLGRLAIEQVGEGISLLAFLGQVWLAFLGNLARPSRIRWRSLLAVLDGAGLDAVPIVALLSFLVGVVIAYQGGVQLRMYGANIYVVDLVALSMVRELAPLMTAIIVAGRTGSAFTAEIGTMQITQEVDALRSLGLPPLDLLVLPKIFGLILALPLLTILADVAGIAGGIVMSAAMLGVGVSDYQDRIPQAVSLASYLIGLGKAPVFAAIIALVGCFQGFRVSNSADSVGRQTTVSVVQAIFLVIVSNAAFSVLFSALGI